MARMGYRQFDDYDEEDGLSAMGRKNASHAEDIHDEVVRTCDVIVSFLMEQLVGTHPDDWKEVCVDAAFDACRDKDFHALLPSHYDLANYDIRALAVVLEYNLPILEFQRGARVRPREIHAFVHIRNLYEHKSQQLNSRRWRSDLEAVRSLRAKMQSDEEIAEESYSIDELPQMETNSEQYLTRLDSLQHQIEALVNTMLGMGDRLADSARIDEDQFAELNRQHNIDEEHDRSIGELGGRLDANAQVDVEQAAELRRQSEVDTSHDRSIAEMAERLSELVDRVDELERATSGRTGKSKPVESPLFSGAAGLAAAAGIAAAGFCTTLSVFLRKK